MGDACRSGKIAYANSGEAGRAMMNMRRRGAKVRVYRCDDCHEFHITGGHDPRLTGGRKRQERQQHRG